MNISSIQSQSGYQATQQPRPFQALGAALQSGDMAAAQKAFSQLTSQMQARQANEGQSGNPDSNFQALSQALQSGDITAAQKAFQAMSTGKAHHHGHGHKAEGAQDSSSGSGSASAIMQMLTGSSTINITA